MTPTLHISVLNDTVGFSSKHSGAMYDGLPKGSARILFEFSKKVKIVVIIGYYVWRF